MTSPLKEETPQTLSRRRSLIRSTWRGVSWMSGGPADWAGISSIRGGASMIGRFLGAARSRPERDRRFKIEPEGTFDLQATACSYGMTVSQLEARLASRRRQTAVIAYGTFVLACLFFLGWLRSAMVIQWAALRVMSMLDYLPFCLLFFLIAFYNALVNFQIRVGRTASWREYLSTNQAFWPR